MIIIMKYKQIIIITMKLLWNINKLLLLLWNIQGMEWRPPLHLGVVAIEKGAFGSPSTMVANFTFNFTYYEI